MAKSIFRIIMVTFLTAYNVFSQQIVVNKIEPPNWWVGMKQDTLQLMIYGENLSNASVGFNTTDIEIVEVYQVDNSGYLFVDIIISSSLDAGNYQISLTNNNGKAKYDFPIYERESSEGNHQGFDASDVIYLITPDRFVNSDISNDHVEGLIPDYEPGYHLGRHGGDIQGIINKLDYLRELGVTAIWINPLIENNNDISYHGYAATDFYKIDPRFGTNELYKKLVDEAHKRGLKIIYDHVSNHISINHPWIKNLPTPDWINGTIDSHLDAIHHKMALSDIHADSSTIIQLTKGWFTDSMPDLNQENPFLRKYLIQNTIWWIEYSGLDGVREDTYPYVNQRFLSDWAAALLDQYPDINIVGEVWTGVTAFLVNFQKGGYFPRAFDTNLPSVTDFGMRDTFYKYLKGENTLYNVYETLAKDYLYPDPQNLVVFIDNHDVTRAALAAGGNIGKVKIALTLLLTTRGIPQILYGTEIGMEGGEDHGLLRADFPGGFPGDLRDAFYADGRTEKENEIFNFLNRLLNIRKEHEALYDGTLTHFPPVNDVYCYIKYSDSEMIVTVINGADYENTLSFDTIKANLKNQVIAKCLLTGKEFDLTQNMKINLLPQEILILQLGNTTKQH